ncbi:hypothetical protein D3C79_542560 [compost metagenome]
MLGVYFDDNEFYTPIIKQQNIAAKAIANQCLIINSNGFSCTSFFVHTCIENKTLPFMQGNLAISEAGDPNFRTLQISKNCNEAAMLRREFAYHFCTSDVLMGLAMREVQAHNIDTGQNEIFEHSGRLSRRTKGGDNLGSSQHSIVSVQNMPISEMAKHGCWTTLNSVLRINSTSHLDSSRGSH